MPRSRRANEEGALLIILMVGVAVSMVMLAVAAQAWSTTWKRDNEEELIFRGEQYVIALKAYQADHAKALPLELEELMKPGPRQVRYIRKLFRDPMKKDAKWGLLYMMPGGQKAIYDPVAYQKGQKAKAASGSEWGVSGSWSGAASGDPSSGRNDNSINQSMGTPGLTPISDPNGTGIQGMQGMPGQQGQMGALGQQGQVGQQGGVQGRMGSIRGGGFQGVTTQMTGMSLPPPREENTDEKAVSETPIGWPIAGVITRVVDMEGSSMSTEGETAEGKTPTFKIFRGKEHADEWQFYVGATDDGTAAPQGTLPGGTPPPFLGPGFGGQGPIGGMGGGARPGFGGRQQGGMQPGGMQNQGGTPQNPWFPGKKN